MRGTFSFILLVLTMVVPWGYHIVYCFQHKEYVLLAVGAVIAPLGWLHGVGAFFGWW